MKCEREFRLCRIRLRSALLVPHSARRVRHGERQERQQQPWYAGYEKRGPPSEMRVHRPAQHVAQRRADRNRAIEDRHDAAARSGREVIGQHRRGNRAVGRLADADRRTRHEERDERSDESADRRREAPQRDAEGDQAHARHPVAQRPEERRGDHVHDEERGHQSTELRVAQMPHARIFPEALE